MSRYSKFFLIFIIALAQSCGQGGDEAQSAKNLAKYYLTNGKCADARKALQGADPANDDEVYVILMSNTYACEASFSELQLFKEVDVIAAGATQTLGSLTKLASSNEEKPDSENYQNLLSAIEVIVDSGASASQRINKFGANGGGDLNLRNMFLIITELGKFIQYYGNAGGGVKGAGSSGNTCFINYTNTDAKNWVTSSGATGACSTTSDGSADLPGPVNGATTKRRLCEGLMLFNNLRDTLSNLDLGDDFKDINGIADALNSAVGVAEGQPGGASITTAKDILSVAECEDGLSAADLEIWYAYIFETGFQ